jgi:hypothetical protein
LEHFMTQLVIGQRYCGPPNSGNGGYVGGLLARDLDGPVKAVIRARVPLDAPLRLETRDGETFMTDAEGAVIGKGEAGDPAVLPEVPAAPSLAAAEAAGLRHPGHTERFHPICFSCGPQREEGDGLRVFVGQLDGAAPGVSACVWTPHAAFADDEGLAPVEVIWAALDCPGFFAWVIKEGRHGALLGTMTGEILRRPPVGEPCIVMAWPLERDGRKEFAGVALFSASGELLARAHQVWITMGPAAGAVAPAAAAVQA